MSPLSLGLERHGTPPASVAVFTWICFELRFSLFVSVIHLTLSFFLSFRTFPKILACWWNSFSSFRVLWILSLRKYFLYILQDWGTWTWWAGSSTHTFLICQRELVFHKEMKRSQVIITSQVTFLLITAQPTQRGSPLRRTCERWQEATENLPGETAHSLYLHPERS